MEQTRWLPNSAFQTYFGKPAFESYGMGNTNPTWGGLGYGQYMVSHNVNPHRSPNDPAVRQVTQSAEIAKTKCEHIKEYYGRVDNFVPKRTKEEYISSANEVKQAKDFLSLDAVQRVNKEKGIEKSEIHEFNKPDLMKTDVFASKDSTPRGSVTSSSRGKKKYKVFTLA